MKLNASTHARLKNNHPVLKTFLAFICIVPCVRAEKSTDEFALQAESFSAGYDSAVQTERSGYTGSGYLDLKSAGAYAEWENIYIADGGIYTVEVRYACSADCPGYMIINDSAAAPLAFPATGIGACWNSEQVTVMLNSGSNTIRIASTGEGPDIDRIAGSITTDNPPPLTSFAPHGIIAQAENYTAINSCSAASAHSGYTGTGYIDYGSAGSYIEWNNIIVGEAGGYLALFAYATPYNRPCSVYVNGRNAGQLSCQSTGDWANWAEERLELPLNTGRNTVRITAVGAGPNLDQMELCSPFQRSDDKQYAIIEGGGPDQGPGRNDLDNINAILSELGAPSENALRKPAYGLQQLRILTRSTDVIRERINTVCSRADSTGIPVWLHLDPIYAWGADTETNPTDAPRVKYWNDPEMREWREFPTDGQLPTYIPRFWFNWGEWCTPAPAFPAIGAPKFVDFACDQLREGVLQPLSIWRDKWKAEDREYLFAGINVGWETMLPYYSANKFNSGITAAYPSQFAGMPIDENLIGVETQFGYASLHWRGWTEELLRATAAAEGISYDQKLQNELYRCIHDYMTALAKECADMGIGPDQVYTHIVALESAQYDVSTARPPIWTAVNPYSTPGFTMDNRGGAKFELTRLKDLIRKAEGSRNLRFGCVETYLKLGDTVYATDAAAFNTEMQELYSRGARTMSFYGTSPLNVRAPEAGIDALNLWKDIPVIQFQSDDQIISETDSVRLTFYATGSSISYQWLFNGEAVPDATSRSLTLNALTSGQSGRYSVIVSNTQSRIVSNPLQLMVVPPVTDDVAPILESSNSTNGNLTINYSTDSGYRYVLQQSTTMTNWTGVLTNTPAFVHGNIEYSANPTNPAGYYRVTVEN